MTDPGDLGRTDPGEEGRAPAGKSRFQWRTSVLIHAPRERVWAIGDDLTQIPEYHPEVGKVDLLSGRRTRALGVKYRCTILVPRGAGETELVLEARYEPVGWKNRVLNALVLRRLMARRARRTLEGLKRLAEAE